MAHQYVRITIWLTKEQRKAARERAKKVGSSISEHVRQLIAKELI